MITNHLLDEAKKKILPGGSSMLIRRLLVIHFTSGASAESSISYWQDLDNGVCAHLIIDRDGSVFQCRSFDKTAGHAGVSRWKEPKTDMVRKDCNKFSIGIELANGGDNEALAKKYGTEGTVTLRHKNGGPLQKWEAYSKPQLATLFKISKELVEKYNLDDVVGHEDIAPERKNDPGPAFPMADLRKACGFSGLPFVNKL